ncbi:MAG: hypothetical protein AAGF76_09505 [Pseudomonadota bacterium]
MNEQVEAGDKADREKPSAAEQGAGGMELGSESQANTPLTSLTERAMLMAGE